MILQRVLKLVGVMALLIAIGTVGFSQIEGWPLADSLYMTVITISTVGFGEMRELSADGRTFTAGLIMLSIVCMACWTAGITSVIVEGDISGAFREQRMKRKAGRMKDHIIVCGSGVFACSTIELLYGGRHSIVVISNNEKETEFIRSRFRKVAVIEQPPTDELALAHANLVTARYVVAATQSDIDNLLISMTCKSLNSNLNVFTFSLESKHAGRMAKLGVDEVVCPHLLGGTRVAELIEQFDQSTSDEPMVASYLTP